jgi:hypothetical protein
VTPHRPAAVLGTLLVLGTGVAEAGPITSNTALPVHSGELIFREQLVWMRSTGDESAAGRELDVLMAPTVLVYGLDARLTVMGVLPFLYKRMEASTPGGRVARETTGFGDMMAVVRWSALQLDEPGETIRLAPLAGVKLPTGAQDEADELGRFPEPFQLGSGSWDPLGGIVFTWQRLRWELDAQVLYHLRTEANDFDAGDEARADVSFQYRLLPWGAIGAGVPSFLYAVLETTIVWTDEDRTAGAEDPSSGGFVWYVTPGVQWISKRSVLEAAVQLPAAQRMNGLGLRNDFVGVLSFRQSW